MNSTYTKLSRRKRSVRIAPAPRPVLKAALLSIAGLLCAAPPWATAAQLPNGTKLLLTPGNAQVLNDPDFLGNPIDDPCTTGSCFGMFNRTVGGRIIYDYIDIVPGTDGGFILGKAQLSGGQELAPSALNTATGELTKAWSYGNSWGTFFTAPDSTTNIFDSASCTGAGCLNKTELKVWHTAWNGQIIPMGSAAGCNKAALPACTADQVAGIFVSEWTIVPVDGGAWSMKYSQIVPAAFPNFPYSLVLRGTVTTPKPTANAGPNQSVLVLGSTINLSGTCTGNSAFADGAISSCAWTQISTNAPAVTLTQSSSGTGTSATNSASFTAASSGQYKFRLTATDSKTPTGKTSDVADSTSTDSDVNINVNVILPVASAGPDQSNNEGTTFSVSGTCTDNGTVAACVWSTIGTGLTIVSQSATGTGPTTATATVQAPADVGQNTNYTLRLTATDNDGNTSLPDDMVVTVVDVAASAGQSSTASGCSLSTTPVKLEQRGDWLLVLGFLAWLGTLIRRRQQTRA